MAQGVRSAGVSDFWKGERDFIFPQEHLINALSWFLILPVYFISSHVRETRWLVLGFPADQALSWCWSAQPQQSPVKLGWLTPADSLAPYHLSPEGSSICYPFGAPVNVCLTLEVHFAVPDQIPGAGRASIDLKVGNHRGRGWLLLSHGLRVFIVPYSTLSSLRHKNDGAGGTRPAQHHEGGPGGCDHGPTFPQGSDPAGWSWVSIPRRPRSSAPSCIIAVSHTKDERLARTSASQGSIPHRPLWDASPPFQIQLGNNYDAIAALAFDSVTNHPALNATQLCRSAPGSGFGGQASTRRCSKVEVTPLAVRRAGRAREKEKTTRWGFFRRDISVMYQQRKFCLQNPVSKTLLRMYVYNCLKKHRVTDTDANLVGHMEHLHLPFSFFLATAGTDLVCEILLAGVLIKTEISVRI